MPSHVSFRTYPAKCNYCETYLLYLFSSIVTLTPNGQFFLDCATIEFRERYILPLHHGRFHLHLEIHCFTILLFQRLPGVLLWGRLTRPEADHSPPTRAEVKKEWSCTSIPSLDLLSVHSDNFTFTFTSSCHLTRRCVLLPAEYFFKLKMCNLWTK